MSGSIAANPVVAADNGFAAATQALTESLRLACNDPSDSIRLLSDLAGYQPESIGTTATIGNAIYVLQTCMGQLFRRAALTSLARACATYQPSSWDDAQAVCAAVAAVFDAEILIAADAGQDATYMAFRTLRTSVVTDLLTRGADLARLTTVVTPAPTPALTLAYRLYRDATRADDLIARADPVSPLFMPTAFLALAS